MRAGGRISAFVLCLALCPGHALAQFPPRGAPAKSGLPHARITGPIPRPEACSPLVQNVEESRAVLESFAYLTGSPNQFHRGLSKAYGDFLVHVGRAGKAVDVANAVLNVLDRTGGFDHGELNAVLGAILPFLPARERRLVERVQNIVWGGLTALETVEAWRDAYDRGELPAEVESTLMSSIAGLADLGRRRLLTNEHFQRIASSPVADAGRLLLFAPAETRERLVRDFLDKQIKDQAGRLKDSLSPQLVGLLYTFQQDPSLSNVAGSVLRHYGYDGERAAERAAELARHLDERFQAGLARTDVDLRRLNQQIALLFVELGLDVGSLVGGPTVGRICTAARGCIALARGDYLTAGFAALELLPVLRQFAHRNRHTRIGAAALRLFDLGKEFHRAIQFVAKLQQHVDQGRAVLALAQGTVERLRNGESLARDPLVAGLVNYGLDRAHLPRLGQQIDDVTQQLQTANTPLARLARAVINPGDALEDEACRIAGRLSPVRRALDFFQRHVERPLVRARETISAGLRPATSLLDRLSPFASHRALPDEALGDVEWVTQLLGLSAPQATALNDIVDSHRQLGHYLTLQDLQAIGIWMKGQAGVGPTVARPPLGTPPAYLPSSPGLSPYAPTYHPGTWRTWPADQPSPYGTWRTWPSGLPSPYPTVSPYHPR